jgi:hypothetical protein
MEAPTRVVTSAKSFWGYYSNLIIVVGTQDENKLGSNFVQSAEVPIATRPTAAYPADYDP